MKKWCEHPVVITISDWEREKSRQMSTLHETFATYDRCGFGDDSARIVDVIASVNINDLVEMTALASHNVIASVNTDDKAPATKCS